MGGRIYHETHYAPLLRMQGSVREIAVDIVGADGRRLSVLVNSVLLSRRRWSAAGGADDRLRRHRAQALRARAAGRARSRAGGARARRAPPAHHRRARGGARTPRRRDGGDRRAGGGVRSRARRCRGLRRAARSELSVVARTASPMRADIDVPGSCEQFDEGAAGARCLRCACRSARRAGRDGRLWLGFAEARAFGAEERGLPGRLRRADRRWRWSAPGSTRRRATSPTRSSAACWPAPAPQDPRFEVATLYRPAVAHLQVGGDWHDAFTLADGKVGIVVGDVVGRGIAAASAMGQLRSAVRALAGAGLAPAAVLDHLDTFVEQVDAARYATLAYAEVDPDSGDVTFASAGHLPAVLIGPDGEPQPVHGGPLGAAGRHGSRQPARPGDGALAPGAGFLLYTDGLVERRAEPIDAGLERLLAAIRASPDARRRAGRDAAGRPARARRPATTTCACCAFASATPSRRRPESHLRGRGRPCGIRCRSACCGLELGGEAPSAGGRTPGLGGAAAGRSRAGPDHDLQCLRRLGADNDTALRVLAPWATGTRPPPSPGGHAARFAIVDGPRSGGERRDLAASTPAPRCRESPANTWP